MITKGQALTSNEFHYGHCSRSVGPRGGVRDHITRCRRNGRTKTWVTRPTDFRVPIKSGRMNGDYGYLTQNNAHQFHLPEDCPINAT